MDDNREENIINDKKISGEKFTRNSIVIILGTNLILLLLSIAFNSVNTIEDGLLLAILYSLYLRGLYIPLNIVAIVLGLKGYSIYKKMDKEYICKKRKVLQIISIILLIIMILLICALFLRFIIILAESIFLRIKAI